MSSPAAPRMAATVIIAAPKGPQDFEVFMVKRAQKSGFMAGAHVFPGGVLDAADDVDSWQELYGPRTLPGDFAFRLASIREAFEESGVLLLEDSARSALLQGDEKRIWRKRVHDDATQFKNLCAELESLPAVFSLKAWSHWVTPTAEPRRYDTRFYVAWTPELPEAHHDEEETVDSTWSSPRSSLDSFEEGTMFLPPPTWYTLRELAAFTDWKGLDEAIRRISPTQPFFSSAGGNLVLALPGDALHDTDPGESEEHRNRIVILPNKRYGFEYNLEGGS